MRGSKSGSRRNASTDISPWHVVASEGCEVRDNNDSIVAELPFGTLIHGSVLDSNQLVIKYPVVGCCKVRSDGGITLLAPGDLLEGAKWRYRVVCPTGAVVREGLELTSAYCRTIEVHSIFEASERRVNRQGLARLRLEDGWVSEALNPLSGQRGLVAQLVPLPSPLRYEVVHPSGAVVRSSPELTSPILCIHPPGTSLEVDEKRFSNHPAKRNVPRLRLSRSEGWVSQCLNADPPAPILRLQGVAIDNTTSAAMPAPTIISPSAPPCPDAKENGDSGRRNGDGEEDECVHCKGRIKKEAIATEESFLCMNSVAGEDHSCVICLSNPRNCTFVHGDTGHIACCLECARVVKANGDSCPVCRNPIEKVIQHFWA